MVKISITKVTVTPEGRTEEEMTAEEVKKWCEDHGVITNDDSNES